MLKQLNRAEIEKLLKTIAKDYRLQIPQQLAEGTRQLATYGSGEISLTGAPVQRKPTSYFFPQTELLITIAPDGSVEVPAVNPRPLALFGLERTDLAGIEFLDRFFSASPADDRYLNNRSGALLIALTGYAGVEGGFLPLSSGNCDLELIATEHYWLALGHSATGKQLLENFSAGNTEQLATLKSLSGQQPDNSNQLQHASQLLRDDKVPDEFWSEIADRCILCSGCNLACPTCSCFCMQDRVNETDTERSRVWDSCQLDAFMREASGHNPLGTETLRTRRRIHHKLVADVDRWGEIGCVACGRCDRACPTGIGIMAVVDEMIRRFRN